MTLGLLGGEAAERFLCSRAGCSERADHAIRWQNPRIHTDGRKKTWLACDRHVGYLSEFLASRDFPLEIVPVADLEADVNAGDADA